MSSASVAIVTGASKGIGRSTALRLANDFSSIVIVARNKAALEETAAMVKESGGAKVLVLVADLSEPSAANTVVSATLEAFGRIDALVNIAGAVAQVDLFEMKDDEWDAGFNLKLHGARRLTIRAWDALKAAGGSVVLMSGNSASAPKAAFAAVATVNAAVVALSKAFADRGLEDNVQVNAVLPGPVMTSRRRTFLEKMGTSAQCDCGNGTKNFPSGGWDLTFR